MALSGWHIAVLVLVVMILFGRRVPNFMADIGKGVKEFRRNLLD